MLPVLSKTFKYHQLEMRAFELICVIYKLRTPT